MISMNFIQLFCILAFGNSIQYSVQAIKLLLNLLGEDKNTMQNLLFIAILYTGTILQSLLFLNYPSLYALISILLFLTGLVFYKKISTAFFETYNWIGFLMLIILTKIYLNRGFKKE